MTAPSDQFVDVERVRACASAMGLDLAEGTASDLASFGNLFLRWNARINLGGAIAAGELVDRHFLDAFAVARLVTPLQRVIDVGSGGGLPVVPLAIVSVHAHFESYERTGKKVAFLRTAVRESRLAGRLVINSVRLAAPLDVGLSNQFDLAISRATFAPAQWLRLGLTLVRPGGQVVVFATDEPPAGCPVAEQIVQYAPNRRLLVFRR